MKRIALLGTVFVFLGLLSVPSSLGQTDLELRGKLEVVIERYESDKTVERQLYQFRLAFGQQGSLRNETSPSSVAANTPTSCRNVYSSHGGQFLGQQVDATVSPSADGKFKIHLVVMDRSFAGCRPVGNLEIPVYSNRTLSHDLVLNDGGSDEVQSGIDKTSGASTRVRVALTIVPR